MGSKFVIIECMHIHCIPADYKMLYMKPSWYCWFKIDKTVTTLPLWILLCHLIKEKIKDQKNNIENRGLYPFVSLYRDITFALIKKNITDLSLCWTTKWFFFLFCNFVKLLGKKLSFMHDFLKKSFSNLLINSASYFYFIV